MKKKRLKFKKRKSKVSLRREDRIYPDQILLQSRQVLLNGVINRDLSKDIIEKLIALVKLDKKSPVYMWINSPGGTTADGFAIIDTMKGMSCPIITIITGEAASMAGLISIAGDGRYMTENSVWMAHDIFVGTEDYGTKVRARVHFYDMLQKQLFEFLSKHTKLTTSDLQKAQHEELWLLPEECVIKGVVDGILRQGK